MSLTTCPYCQHENSAMRIYREMNLKHKCSGEITECEKCNKMMAREHKQRNVSSRIFSGILWMLPAIILIVLVGIHKIDYKLAILLIILFHIVSFWAIIRFGKYSK